LAPTCRVADPFGELVYLHVSRQARKESEEGVLQEFGCELGSVRKTGHSGEQLQPPEWPE